MTNPRAYLTLPAARLEALMTIVVLYEMNLEREFVIEVCAMDNVTDRWLERQLTRDELRVIGMQWAKAAKEGRDKLKAHNLTLPKMQTLRASKHR